MQNPFQLHFFRILKTLLPENLSIPDALSDILEVSSDSAYRRLRGETALSIDEAIKICSHYKIPISLFVQDVPGLATFRYVNAENKTETFKKYIAIQEKAMQDLIDSENSKIYYAAIDAPLFHHYGYEKISSFKFHFWMQIILGLDGLKGAYKIQDIDKELLRVAKKIHTSYLQIPSVEIWSDNILDTTIKQIEYYWESGFFINVQDAYDILESLKLLLSDVQKMAEHSTKLVGYEENAQVGHYELYQSDILLTNNTALTFNGDRKSTYISHQTFNMLICTEDAYCRETEEWFKKIKSKSTLISSASEKSRNRFFKKLNVQIDELILKIKNN